MITAQRILEGISQVSGASTVGSDTKKPSKKTAEKTKSVLPAAKPVTKPTEKSSNVPAVTSDKGTA